MVVSPETSRFPEMSTLLLKLAFPVTVRVLSMVVSPETSNVPEMSTLLLKLASPVTFRVLSMVVSPETSNVPEMSTLLLKLASPVTVRVLSMVVSPETSNVPDVYMLPEMSKFPERLMSPFISNMLSNVSKSDLKLRSVIFTTFCPPILKYNSLSEFMVVSPLMLCCKAYETSEEQSICDKRNISPSLNKIPVLFTSKFPRK